MSDNKYCGLSLAHVHHNLPEDLSGTTLVLNILNRLYSLARFFSFDINNNKEKHIFFHCK